MAHTKMCCYCMYGNIDIIAILALLLEHEVDELVQEYEGYQISNEFCSNFEMFPKAPNEG